MPKPTADFATNDEVMRLFPRNVEKYIFLEEQSGAEQWQFPLAGCVVPSACSSRVLVPTYMRPLGLSSLILMNRCQMMSVIPVSYDICVDPITVAIRCGHESLPVKLCFRLFLVASFQPLAWGMKIS